MTIRENYEQWLNDFVNDTDTIRELESIRNDEKEIEKIDKTQSYKEQYNRRFFVSHKDYAQR